MLEEAHFGNNQLSNLKRSTYNGAWYYEHIDISSVVAFRILLFNKTSISPTLIRYIDKTELAFDLMRSDIAFVCVRSHIKLDALSLI